MLVNGEWREKWTPLQGQDEKGRFLREESQFRNWIVAPDQADDTTEFVAEAGRYHLYVGYICPWASRTLMVRKLKKLEDVISVSVVDPRLSDQGWRFSGYLGSDETDPEIDATHIHNLYSHSISDYTGRCSIPVLWDKKTKQIVNNESSEIIRMLNSAFDDFGDASVDLYPEPLRDDIDQFTMSIYNDFNNGVYRSGFATTAEAYEEALGQVFDTLDSLEARLEAGGPFIHGEQLTESDIKAFVTLIRFDAAYVGLFKCNIRRIEDYPNILAYTKRVLDLPGIRETVRIDHIKAGYYSIKKLNPNGIVPVGPDLSAYGLES